MSKLGAALIAGLLSIVGVTAVNWTINQPNTLTVNNPQNVYVNKTPVVPKPTVTPSVTATPTP